MPEIPSQPVTGDPFWREPWILYFQRRRLLQYQTREIRSRLHSLRSDFVDLHVRLWDWRQERSAYHPPYQGDWERDMTLSELVDEFGLNALRLVKLCDVWFQERGLEDGRRKFAASVAPYRQDQLKLMDPWGNSSDTKPRSALLETIVTELIPYQEFAQLDHPTVHHRQSR